MRYKQTNTSDNNPTYTLVFDKGDKVMEELQRFAVEQQITAASFVGLGAFSSATLAFYDRQTKGYDPIPVQEQTEVLNVTGNIAIFNGEPRLHVHATLGRPDGSTIGGHLVEGAVWPTLEIALFASSEVLEREMDEETGLPLLKA
ncbi:MAG: DNA-binding protein [Ignavibacteriae bacterium]|nr:DNA-binding protein [Ignavibacteriota bacterium]MCB9217458.1 DNA-binding protein [Ignavibacteria bacterium]